MADLLVCALVKAGLSTPASLVGGLAPTRSSSSTKHSSPAVLARCGSAVYLAPAVYLCSYG